MELTTQERVERTVRSARDSVWVINEQLEKLANGAQPSQEIKRNIERNVGHLSIVVANKDVIEHGGDISDINAAISAGNAKLAEDIWG